MASLKNWFEHLKAISQRLRKEEVLQVLCAQNLESAKSRLNLCAKDVHSQIEKVGNTSELCSQLGAVLGMLGDCCRAMGDSSSAVTYFEESVEFLSKLPKDDLEITHTLSVSKIGDLQAARSYYFQSLNVRRDVVINNSNVSSQLKREREHEALGGLPLALGGGWMKKQAQIASRNHMLYGVKTRFGMPAPHYFSTWANTGEEPKKPDSSNVDPDEPNMLGAKSEAQEEAKGEAMRATKAVVGPPEEAKGEAMRATKAVAGPPKQAKGKRKRNKTSRKKYIARTKARQKERKEAEKAKNEEGHTAVRKTLREKLLNGDFDFLLNTDASLVDPSTFPGNFTMPEHVKQKKKDSGKWDITGSIGVILRDKTGNPIFIYCEPIKNTNKGSTALECDAVTKGMEIFHELGKVGNVLAQTDNLSAVTITENESENSDHEDSDHEDSDHEGYLRKMEAYKNIFKQKEMKLEFAHVPRAENQAADQIAKFARLDLLTGKVKMEAEKNYKEGFLFQGEIPTDPILKQIIENEKIDHILSS